MDRESGSESSEPFYFKQDELVWCRREPDGTVTVGFIVLPGFDRGPVTTYSPRKVGKHIRKGISCATLEWPDWVEPARAPVGGEVIAVNAAVQEDPSLVSLDPFGEGWLVRLQPDDWQADSADLSRGRVEDMLRAMHLPAVAAG